MDTSRGTWAWVTDMPGIRSRLAHARRERVRFALAMAFAAFLALVAVALAVWPFASARVGDLRLEAAADTVARDADPASVEAAREYNARLADGGQTVIGGDPMAGDDAFTGEGDPLYAKALAGGADGAMGVVEAPAIGMRLPVYHGSSYDVLAHGAGHLPGTSLPIGGPGTHAVLTGHSYMPDATLFTNLDDLAPGDVIDVTTAAGTVSYSVTDISVVPPDDVNPLRIESGRDLLTLVTCTGTGNSMRLLVTGERIASVPAGPRRSPLWLWVTGSVLVAAVIAAVVRAVFAVRRRGRPGRALHARR